MKILKFGGTSVGSAQRMKDVAKLICTGDRNIVVLSAMSGTTNRMVQMKSSISLHRNITDISKNCTVPTNISRKPKNL